MIINPYRQSFISIKKLLKAVYCNSVRRTATASNIRNIGIIAHIDAGKTTTTERLLYHSGAIKSMGNVDSGNTVTDYLPSERSRGITVQSAAVSTEWKGTLINIIDTPGHVDFTLEVECALHALDGAIAIFDASRGVEAQTRTVWRQADKLNLPRIAFLNKMDKSTANFSASERSMKELLFANTCALQVPFYDKGEFCGVLDLINLTLLKWKVSETSRSETHFSTVKLNKHSSCELWETALQQRREMIETLSDIDDNIANLYLSDYSKAVELFPAALLENSLRSAVKNCKTIPVFCGSAVRNIAVHLLLDAISKYLPSSCEAREKFTHNVSGGLLAYAFKLVHHKRLGSLVFIRVYSGHLTSQATIHNVTKNCKEKITQLYTIFGEEYRVSPRVSQGQIVAISGLKYTGTGDMISDVSNAKIGEEDLKFSPLSIPEPVFFRTVEVDSLMQSKALEESLAVITREDPAVSVKQDTNTGQTILCGMGELHMEVITERLLNEFKIKCITGPLQVAYRERPTEAVMKDLVFERTILKKHHKVELSLAIEPNDTSKTLNVAFGKKFHKTHSPELIHALKAGVIQATQSSVIMGFPLIETNIIIHKCNITSNCPLSVVSAAAASMTSGALDEADCCVLEPMMDVEVVTDAMHVQIVLGSLSQAGSTIINVTNNNADHFISAKAPVIEMLGYARKLRTLSSGHANLSLHVAGYRRLDYNDTERLRNRLAGAGR